MVLETSLEAELKKTKLQLEMSEKSRKVLEEDIAKSDGIILKLQEKVKAGCEKVKAKSEFKKVKSAKSESRQGQKIEEKEKLLYQLERETAEKNILLEAKNTEVKMLNDSVSSLQKKVENFEIELENRDNVIKYLSRQLTDRQIVRPYTPPPNLGPSPSSIAKKQLEKINSGDRISTSPDNSPITHAVTNGAVPKTTRKSDSTPSRHHQTDSAYGPSPSGYTNQFTRQSI